MTLRLIHPTETVLSEIVRTIRELAFGRSLAVGTFTLAAGVTTTTVVARNCGADSQILCFPKTAAAATELGAGGMYVSSVAPGSFVVTHANDASTTRTFGYAALG